jgi:beta-galactosidase
MDQIPYVLKNGFERHIDIPGINYNTQHYAKAFAQWHQKIILGSETASTVSSRGVYKFPMQLRKMALYPDHQSSSYDVECCNWSNTPDTDFALAEDNKWYAGQFVWTGFDYLGEPTPYNNDNWPSHSSLFGIIDLANIPKDRYYLYRSQWNRHDHTLHILPH